MPKRYSPNFDYFAQNVAWIMGQPYSKRGFSIGVDRRIDALYLYLRQHYSDRKTFYVTRTTIDRVRNMDVNEVTPDMAMYLCSKESCGSVLMATQSGEEKFSFNYAIKSDGIFIDVYTGKLLHHVDDPDAFLRKSFVGSIIITDNEVAITPNSTFSLMLRMIKSDDKSRYLNQIKVDPSYSFEAIKMLNEIDGVDGKELAKLTYEEMKVKYPFTAELQRQETEKHNVLVDCYKLFLFIHTTDVTKGDYISEPPTKVCSYRRSQSKLPTNTIVVDSTYDMDINVINPFSVTGHFKMQACGKERKDHKLIYVDSYMKQGYHRTATKTRKDI